MKCLKSNYFQSAIDIEYFQNWMPFPENASSIDTTSECATPPSDCLLPLRGVEGWLGVGVRAGALGRVVELAHANSWDRAPVGSFLRPISTWDKGLETFRDKTHVWTSTSKYMCKRVQINIHSCITDNACASINWASVLDCEIDVAFASCSDRICEGILEPLKTLWM